MYKRDQEIQIYVPSANYGRYLPEALQSVVKQTFKLWHCFIIDENSSDDTSKVAEHFIEKFGADKFTLVANKERLGLQKLSNWVFKNTNSPYVIRLDADDVWMPHLLEKLYFSLKTNENAAIAFGSFIYISDDNEILVEETSVNHLNRYDSGLDAPHGACTLIDRKKFLNEGLYFEDVDAQDGWDLWLKCFPKYEFISIDEPLFYYRQHAASLSRNSKRILTARRSLIRLNLNGVNQSKIRVFIPLAKNLSLKNKSVTAHLSYLIKILKQTMHCLIPVITLDAKDQFNEIKSLNLPAQFEFTGGSFEYGMNPFKLLEQTASFDGIKMWLNFNSMNVDSEVIDAALDTFFKFNLQNCISVQEQREPIFQLTSTGLCCVGNGRYSEYKLKADELWRMNNVLLISRFEKGENSNQGRTGFFEMCPEESRLIHDW